MLKGIIYKAGNPKPWTELGGVGPIPDSVVIEYMRGVLEEEFPPGSRLEVFRVSENGEDAHLETFRI